MRVAIVNRHLADKVGGSEVQTGLLAEQLTARGHDVVYVAPTRGSPADYGTDYEVVPVAPRGGAIGGAVVDARPDVVYWRFNKIGLRAAARRIAAAGIPLVFAVAHITDLQPWAHRPQGGNRLRALAAVPVMKTLSRWRHPGLAYAMAMTTNNPDYLPLLRTDRAVYVANGMRADAVPFAHERPFCLWVANLKGSKRPDLLVPLARELAADNVDLLVVGVPQEPGYEHLVEGRGLPPNLHYLGPKSLEEVNGMFAAADLHVHTCMPEGFSNVFIQAWLQGCPSVSLGFDPGGYIESQGLGGDAGDDWQQFVRLVRELLDDDGARAAAGERARAFAQATFGVETMVDRVEALLHEVVSGSRPRA